MFNLNKDSIHKLLEVFGVTVLILTVYQAVVGILFGLGIINELDIMQWTIPIHWPHLVQIFRYVVLIGLGAIYNTWLHFFPNGDLFCVLVLAPIFEELQFRLPLLFIKNKKLQFWMALLSSVIFAICHPYGVFGIISTFLVGCCLSFLAIKTKSVKYSMALHALCNFLAVVR